LATNKTDVAVSLLDGDLSQPLHPELYSKLVTRLHGFIGKGRVEHVEGVARSAVELSRLHAPALLRKAQVAALLHDHAKKLTDDELTELAVRFDIVPTSAEREVPQLMHGAIGAALLPERFGLNDDELAEAVADHVTGRPDMGRLSQLLFVADQIEPGREFPGVDQIRQLAKTDLRAAVALVARRKIEYVLQKGQVVDQRTVEVWNSFRR
jgi:predicted HD superfamily hydrolase involved in NAD metabolism